MSTVEETPPECVWIVVVLGDPAHVPTDLSEKQRLNEAPGERDGMPVAERSSQSKGAIDIAGDVEISAHIRLGNSREIHGRERGNAALASRDDCEGWFTRSEGMAQSRGSLEREGHL